jgi:hypothetical protein
MIFQEKCPLCGTSGRVWNSDPEVFVCPHCYSLYSEFGLVLEPTTKEQHGHSHGNEMWN